MENKKLTLQEVVKSLRYDDPRQITSMMKNGTIPKVIIDKEGLSILESDLADFLKLEDITEPFMTAREAQEFLGISAKLSVGYCQVHGIPFTIVGKPERGKKPLFRKSFLEKWKNETLSLSEDLSWVKKTTQIALQKNILVLISSFIDAVSFPKLRGDILKRYFKGESLTTISTGLGLTKTRTKRILDGSITELNKVIQKFSLIPNHELVRTFLEDPYAFLSYRQETITERNANNLTFQQRIIELEKFIESKGLIVPAVNPSNHHDEFILMRKLLDTPIGDLDITVRVFNCLQDAKIETLKEVVQLNNRDLLCINNFGRGSLAVVEELLTEKGLSFGMDISKYYPREEHY